MNTKRIKTIVAVILAISVMFSVPVSSYAADSMQLGTIAKNEITAKISKNTDLRKEPYANSKSKLALKKGKKIKVTSFSGDWLYVSASSKGKTVKGYVDIDFVAHNSSYILQKTSVKLESGSSEKLKTMNLKGKSFNSSVTWSSSDTNVAKVSTSGKISGVGLGSAKIYATKSGKTYVCNVSVNQAAPKVYYTYSVNKKTAIYKDKKKKTKLTTIPKNASVSFKEKAGKLTKVSYTSKKGEKFKGYVESSAVKKKKNYKYVYTKSLKVANSVNTLFEGRSYQLTAQVYPLNSTQTVYWYTNNPDVVSITQSGVIKAVGVGAAYISARSGSEYYGFRVEVPRTGIFVDYSTVPIAVGASYQVSRNAEVSGMDTSTTQITSSNTGVAEVVDGFIYAKSPGLATISVKNGNYSNEFNVYVHPISKNAAAPFNTFFYTDLDYDNEAYDPVYVPLKDYAPENSYNSDGAYHPECLYFEEGFAGYKYWLTYTPYPYYNDGYENPCILASNDLVNWEIPDGGQNPIEPRPLDYHKGWIYNSDTDLVYNDDTKMLECWWREYCYDSARSDGEVYIYRKCSTDGVTWSEKEAMLVSEHMFKKDYLSPAVLYEDGVYKMWAVDLRNKYSVVYQEYDPKVQTWSEQRIIKIDYSVPDLQSWHLSVTHTPKGYEMVLSASKKSLGSYRLSMDLYYCYSTDNINYTMADTMLQPSRGTNNWDNQGIYRSSLMYANGKYYLFYPGINDKKGPRGIAVISGDDPFELK